MRMFWEQSAAENVWMLETESGRLATVIRWGGGGVRLTRFVEPDWGYIRNFSLQTRKEKSTRET
jgi:hypothetical protein